MATSFFLYDSILKVLLEKETLRVLNGSFTFTIVILSLRRISSDTILMSCTKRDSSVAETTSQRQGYVCSLRMTSLIV